MKTYLALAWKELWAQKVTTALILIAVLLSTIMTAALGQAVGILNEMRIKQASELNGNRYATLHQLPRRKMEKLSADSRLSYAGAVIPLGIVDLPESSLSLLIREYQGNAISAYQSAVQLQTGRLPEAPGEIALPQDALHLLGFQGNIGDPIDLPVRVLSFQHDADSSYEYTGQFILTGILKPNYIGYVSGTVIGIAGEGTAEQSLPEKYQLYSLDIRTTETKTFQNTLDDMKGTYSIPEENIQYNEVLLSALGIHYRNENSINTPDGFSIMTAAAILTVGLVLLAAGLVIYNILKIAVAKRIREYGVLRAMGADRGKVSLLVALQILFICGAGIPLGILIGFLSAKGITSAAAGFFSPDMFLASSLEEVTSTIAAQSGVNILPLLISGGISLSACLIAAMPAAAYASRVSPVSAMAGENIFIRRRNRKEKRIRHFEAFYARMNLKRSPGRSAVTIASLSMSIAILIALQSVTQLLDTSSKIQKMHQGDYSVTNLNTGFPREAVESIRNIPGIQTMHILRHQVFSQNESGNIPGMEISFPLQPGEAFHLCGIDEEWLKSIAKDVSQAEIQALLDGSGCLIQNPFPFVYDGTVVPRTELKIGDTISVNGKPMKIMGEIQDTITPDNEGFINGVQVIVTASAFEQLTGFQQYTELYPILSQDSDRGLVEQELQRICEQYGGRWLSYQETDQQLRESFEQIQLLAWGFTLFVGLIGILNIINTVYTNIHTRLHEIGVQRAIGMSAGNLYQTFLWEGAYYGIFAAGIGGIAGYLCTVLFDAASSGIFRLTAAPIPLILQAALLAVAVCLLATGIPLKRVSRLGIVESLGCTE